LGLWGRRRKETFKQNKTNIKVYQRRQQYLMMKKGNNIYKV